MMGIAMRMIISISVPINVPMLAGILMHRPDIAATHRLRRPAAHAIRALDQFVQLSTIQPYAAQLGQ